MLGDFDGEKLKGLMFINVKISPAVLPCGLCNIPYFKCPAEGRPS